MDLNRRKKGNRRMTFNEFQSMMLFRRIIETDDNSITLDNGIRLIKANFSNVILNTEITLAIVNEENNHIILTSNQEPICDIESIDNVEVVMPKEPSEISLFDLRPESGENIER